MGKNKYIFFEQFFNKIHILKTLMHINLTLNCLYHFVIFPSYNKDTRCISLYAQILMKRLKS